LTAKRDADLAWLKLFVQRLEKLHISWRPHAVEPPARKDASRKKHKRSRPRSSRARRVEALKDFVLQKAIDLGREFFDPADEARHDDERCLQRYAEMMELSPQAREVFRLNRTEGMEHDEIASFLNMKMSAVEDHLLAIMLAVLEVQEFLDHEAESSRKAHDDSN
jgi:DNA-directed RNA polymerase specialized sigma24 family protein